MESTLLNEAKDAFPLTGVQAAVLAKVAPRALSVARTLFARHPIIFVSSLVLGAWAWKKYREGKRASESSFASSQAQTGPADLIH
jgi:hypothetical protein